MSIIIPPNIVKQLNKKYKLEEEFYLTDGNFPDSGHSIRVNPSKLINSIPYKVRIPWCEEGYSSAKLIRPQSDPLFHAGCYCIQDAPSMFVAYILKSLQVKQHPIKILDILGGSGTLGTLLLDNAHPESLIVVNENSKLRLRSVLSTLDRWGSNNSFVSNDDPATFSKLSGYFDILLVCPPNSRKQENITSTDQERASINIFSEQQKHILTNSLNSLKTEGILIYATHSDTVEENEEIANWLCEEHGMEAVTIRIDPNWNIEEKTSNNGAIGFRFRADELNKTAFFVTVLKKKKAQEHFISSETNTQQSSLPYGFMKKWVKTDIEMCTIVKNNTIHLFPKSLESDFNTFKNVLKLKKTGICMGRLIQDQFIPHKGFAFSNILHPMISKKALSKEDALRFIKKGKAPNENEIPSSTLVTFDDFGLGWS